MDHSIASYILPRFNMLFTCVFFLTMNFKNNRITNDTRYVSCYYIIIPLRSIKHRRITTVFSPWVATGLPQHSAAHRHSALVRLVQEAFGASTPCQSFCCRSQQGHSWRWAKVFWPALVKLKEFYLLLVYCSKNLFIVLFIVLFLFCF